jgi:hypothetical protein
VTKEKEGTVIEVKPAKEISASSLQNPADDTATFRRKGDEEHQGYVLNVAETCSPANPVQLLTDVSLYPNVISDEPILCMGCWDPKFGGFLLKAWATVLPNPPVAVLL